MRYSNAGFVLTLVRLTANCCSVSFFAPLCHYMNIQSKRLSRKTAQIKSVSKTHNLVLGAGAPALIHPKFAAATTRCTPESDHRRKQVQRREGTAVRRSLFWIMLIGAIFAPLLLAAVNFSWVQIYGEPLPLELIAVGVLKCRLELDPNNVVNFPPDLSQLLLTMNATQQRLGVHLFESCAFIFIIGLLSGYALLCRLIQSRLSALGFPVVRVFSRKLQKEEVDY